jgi:hypothetical protein
MNPTRIFISIIVLTFLTFSCSEKKKSVKSNQLKSVYGLQNDTIVSIKNYDREGHLIFDRTTQIIESWDNGLMTWMTAIEFEGNKPLYQYYAHSNSGLRITFYDYDNNGELNNEYSKFFSSSNKYGRNPFAEICEIETRDSLKAYLLRAIPDSIPFSIIHRASKESTDFYKTYTDSLGYLVKEYWTIADSSQTNRIIKKYDSNGNLIYEYNKNRWNEGIEQFQYDSNGKLKEELEIWDPQNNRFQKKVHLYSNGLLQKTLFYHDTALAFTYEYFYNDTLLEKEIKTRVTEAEPFKDRKRKVIIEYRYEYFD